MWCFYSQANLHTCKTNGKNSSSKNEEEKEKEKEGGGGDEMSSLEQHRHDE